MSIQGLGTFSLAPKKDDSFDDEAFTSSRSGGKKKVVTVEVRGSQFNGADLLIETGKEAKIVTPEKGKTYKVSSPGKTANVARVKDGYFG